jgi:hypothetical protein
MYAASVLAARTAEVLGSFRRTPENVRELDEGTSLAPFIQGPLVLVADEISRYETFLATQGVNLDFFSGAELTQLRRLGQFAVPPQHLWDEMARTILFAAQPIRERFGAPLLIYNAYRPPAYNKLVRGAKRSMHLRNAALDLLPFDRTLRPRLAEVAAAYMLEKGHEFNLGMGIYHYPRMTGLHVDACVRTRATPYASTRRWMARVSKLLQ